MQASRWLGWSSLLSQCFHHHSSSFICRNTKASFKHWTFASRTWTLYKANIMCRMLHVGRIMQAKKKEPESRIVPVDVFEKIKNRNKETFNAALYRFLERDVYRRGHVEFIYAALKHMEEFGVNQDLETYKNLMDLFPKGKMIPQNLIQAEFMHYPKQQECAIDVLQQMEENAVMPDDEMGEMLLNTFGRMGHPVKRYYRMMYWMPKFKNLSPWPLPQNLPNDSLELAKLALQRMCSVDLQSYIEVFEASQLEDSIDPTWIVSAHSPTQRALLKEHPTDKPVYVEGAFRIWLRRTSVSYFILRAEPKPVVEDESDPDDVSTIRNWFFGDNPEDYKTELVKAPSIHEQEDGIILGMCATGTSSSDSLLSWIRFLQRTNPSLADIPVLFTLKSPIGDVISIEDSNLKLPSGKSLGKPDNESQSDHCSTETEETSANKTIT